MTTEYADRKIKDILTKAKGNGKLTEQAVMTLIERDHKFLLSLTQPYLSGVVAHAIGRGRKQTNIKEPAPTLIKTPTKAKTPAVKPMPVRNVPRGSIDKALDAWAKKFETTDEKPAAKKVSQKHLDAMSALVKKNYSKKDKN